jgi:hypothetical protein
MPRPLARRPTNLTVQAVTYPRRKFPSVEQAAYMMVSHPRTHGSRDAYRPTRVSDQLPNHLEIAVSPLSGGKYGWHFPILVIVLATSTMDEGLWLIAGS